MNWITFSCYEKLPKANFSKLILLTIKLKLLIIYVDQPYCYTLHKLESLKLFLCCNFTDRKMPKSAMKHFLESLS